MNGDPGTCPPGPAAPAKTDRDTAMFCHVAAFAGLVFPFGDLIAPLIIWLMKKDGSPYVDLHGREVMNFHISMYIWAFVSVILCLVLVGFVMLLGLMVLGVVCPIVGAVRASEGREYRYPLTIRFL
jgi:uncharacterized Tic20 family protein